MSLIVNQDVHVGSSTLLPQTQGVTCANLNTSTPVTAHASLQQTNKISKMRKLKVPSLNFQPSKKYKNPKSTF